MHAPTPQSHAADTFGAALIGAALALVAVIHFSTPEPAHEAADSILPADRALPADEQTERDRLRAAQRAAGLQDPLRRAPDAHAHRDRDRGALDAQAQAHPAECGRPAPAARPAGRALIIAAPAAGLL